MRNLDLGRALKFVDIIDKDTLPINEDDAGSFCHECVERNFRAPDQLRPLTPSTGVFSRLVLCKDQAPVYLCLDHVPFMHFEFEAFSPELRAELRVLRRVRNDNHAIHG